MQIQQAYEVEKLPGKVSVERCKFEKIDAGNGKFRNRIVREKVEVPAGYMVYLPNGNSIRVKDEAGLEALGISVAAAPLVNMTDGSVVQTPRSLKK